MFAVIHMLRSKYDGMSVGIDPEIDEWFLMKTPTPLFLILGFYLLFVLKVGPQFMTNRKPMNLQPIMIAYNAYQVVFSAWLFSRAIKAETSLTGILNNNCKVENPLDRDFELEVWNGAWWYFFSKIVDLLDTVFFVLRKKQNQVTFLHLYHHFTGALYSWFYLKYLPGPQGIVMGLLNEFVHIIMYFYYMVSAMGPKYQNYLWWKKYVTWVQLLQFYLMLCYLVTIVALDCKLPKTLTFFFAGNCLTFIYLFTDFYRNAYRKKAKENDVVSTRLLNEGDEIKEFIKQE